MILLPQEIFGRFTREQMDELTDRLDHMTPTERHLFAEKVKARMLMKHAVDLY